MKILIAIVTCHRYRERAKAQRDTWIPDVAPAALATGHNVDVRFFLGRPDKPHTLQADEVQVDADDGYLGLPEKTREVYRWALAQGYDFVFKADDDSYVVPSRLLTSGFEQHDYSGRLRGPSGRYPAPYASGFGYWVSARAIRILAEASIDGTLPNERHQAEDRWVGNTLQSAGIECHPNIWHVVVKSSKNKVCFMEAPREGNEVIVACEFEPNVMHRVHQQWKAGERSMIEAKQILETGPFSRVAVLIKTFLRDGYLLRTIDAIEKHLPGMKMVIVDDGYESREKIALYAQLRRRGHACHWLPFDTGFGAKANAGIQYMDREYTLIGSDDFDFAGRGVAEGIQKLISVLDAREDVGSAAGRVDNNPYEGFIEYGEGYIREQRLNPDTVPFELTPEGVKYYLVDHTVNYNLVRSKLLGPGRVTWVEHKIGGDHFDFYHDIRTKMRMKIAWVPGVNITQQRGIHPRNHPKYGHYRARAKQAIPSFMNKHGITRFIAFDGRVDVLSDYERLPKVENSKQRSSSLMVGQPGD